MAANQTTNYQLNQWEATDQILRTDFNADNAKVDAALAGLDAGDCWFTGDDAVVRIGANFFMILARRTSRSSLSRSFRARSAARARRCSRC